MLILSQTKDLHGYHGLIGKPTNMYDYQGDLLFVGDLVCIVTYSDYSKKCYDYEIAFVCEENTKIASWTGRNYQYVMGIASIYNNDNFKVLDKIEKHTDEWWKTLHTIDNDFRVYKVKDHSFLALGERIGFLSVIDTEVSRNEKDT